MALLRPFRASLGAIGRNPALLLVTGLIALVQLPQLAASAFSPLVSAVVSLAFTGVYIVALPYVQGGLVGMADEALDGRTGLGTFHQSGKRHYVAMLVAYLLVLAVNLLIGGGLFVVGVVAGVLIFGLHASTATIAVLGLVGAVLALAYVLTFAFVQFYGPAIVLEDRGGVDGLKRSIGLVRANLLSVFVYTLVVGVGGGLFGLAGGVAALLLSPQPTPGLPLPEPSLPLAVGAGVVLVVVTTVFTAVFVAFSVAFYRDLSGREGPVRAEDDGNDATPSV